MKKFYKANWILQGNKKVIKNGGFYVENGIITEIFENNTYLPEGLEIINLENSVITPGFINLHTHLQYTNLDKTQIEKGSSFLEWIINLISQYASWSEEERLISFKDGLKQSLSTGTTFLCQLSKEEEFIETLAQSKVGAYIFFEAFANSQESSIKEFDNIIKKLEKYNNKNYSNLHFGISPHSIYTAHKELLKKISDYSQKTNTLVQMHFAESNEEMNFLKGNSEGIQQLYSFLGINHFEIESAKPIEYLKEVGLLNKNTLLAHCNQLNMEEFKQLSKNNVKIVHCPRSNMLLHNKTINLNKFKPLMISNVGLGTDSLFSNYDLNLFNEAKFIFKREELLEALDYLTFYPANILNLQDRIGSLEKNKQADFLVFQLADGEDYKDVFNKEKPEHVYIKGDKVI